MEKLSHSQVAQCGFFLILRSMCTKASSFFNFFCSFSDNPLWIAEKMAQLSVERQQQLHMHSGTT